MSTSRSICTVTLAVAGSLAAATNDIDSRLAANPVLASRVQSLLPHGTSLQAASGGFQNTTEFIAALHLSRNLNIPFNELKADLTGPKHKSLSRVLTDLRPELRSKGISRQVKRAEQQTQTDLDLSQESASTGGSGRSQKTAPEARGPNGRS